VHSLHRIEGLQRLLLAEIPLNPQAGICFNNITSEVTQRYIPWQDESFLSGSIFTALNLIPLRKAFFQNLIIYI
jgi:hypothetical protein